MNKKRKNLVIIPARGGSKRIVNKNLYNLCGRPLIKYPIDAARNSELVDRVIVSTDSIDIAEIAKEIGAEVPFMRPSALAQDDSIVVDTIVNTLTYLKENEDYIPDYVVLMQAVNPFVLSKHVDGALKLAIKKKADSVVSVVEVDTVAHPFNVREITSNGLLRFWKEKEHYNYIDKYRPQFYSLGNLIVTNYHTIMEEKKLEGSLNYPFKIDKISGLDIDTIEDMEIVEAVLKNRS